MIAEATIQAEVTRDESTTLNQARSNREPLRFRSDERLTGEWAVWVDLGPMSVRVSAGELTEALLAVVPGWFVQNKIRG